MRSILHCTLWNLQRLRKNPRVLLSLLLGFLICFLLTEKTISIARTLHTNIQIFEPFIWCYADSDSILFASLALLLLLSQIPCLDTPAAYAMFRVRRIHWLLGQVATAIAVSLCYTLLLLLSTILLSAGHTFIANHWSDTATIMSFTPATFEVALTVVRKTIKLTTPYNCTLHIFLLITQYTLFLAMLKLIVSYRFGKQAGMCAVIGISLLAYILTPERFMAWLQLPEELTYYANQFAAWLSPLQHATYTMHNFGYDKLPTLPMTYGIFSILNLLFLAAAYHDQRKIDFTFTGGSDE